MKARRFVAGAFALLLATVGLAGVPGTADAAPAQQDSETPVIIVGGTGTAQPIASVFYAPLAGRLQADGYDTHIFGLPGGGLGDIAEASQDLADLADDVMAQTGSDTVDLVGHSQGGLVGRHYIRFQGGEEHVNRMISLGAPHYGTSLANLCDLFGETECLGITAFEQMSRDSDFTNNLNAGDDSWGDVEYINIATKLDIIVFPYSTSFLDQDSGVTNVAVQDQCLFRPVGHLTLATDGTVYSGIRQGLAGDNVNLNCWAL